AVTLSLSLPRNTYTLTINRNTTYISSVSGAGTYRWGQSVNISATAASNSTFTSWSQTSGATGSFASTTSASTTFIMPTSAATIYADGQAVTYMQDYTVQQCKSEASSNNKTVYDKRDNKAYTVRYINNACYMTQNLAYIGTSSDASGKMTLNVATSNIDTNKTLTYGDLALGDTYDSPRLRVPSDADLAENNGLATATQIGAWYNYAAATGGTITGSSNTETATYDICPKNWHIPTTTSPGSIYDVSSYATAFSPVVGGFYHQGYLHDAKVYGGWGSVVAYNSTTRSDLQYRDGSLSGYIFDRGGGFYVRCVRNDDKPYMQDYTLASCQSEASDANKAVKDKRDEKEYTVRYLNGACWMSQNLWFASTSLNSSTTNMDVTKVFNYGDLTAGDTYTESRLHIPNSTNDSDALKLYSAEQLGYYYNYAAASAGTIATGTNYSNATYDVCPKNWRLPTSDEASGIISNMSSFSPILGGGYGGGSHGDTSSYGCWWTSTYGGSSVSMNRLVYESNGNSDVRGLGWGARNLGFYVRCVRTS
ncbi:hypothetical protein IJ135_02545, partial [Candidatus Saccharibacteria bacterium]|nr:hypothetical protein [Candidatus Saccharibacteria bacterium]